MQLKEQLKFMLVLLFSMHCIVTIGQVKKGKKERFPSYFGFHFRPIFPTNFIGNPTLTLEKDELTTTIKQKLGYSFGATVRAGLTKLLAFESGINFTQRNFDLSMAIPDSNVYAENDLGFICYDIPINALVYIQLSEKIFMNTSLGMAITFKPTNVGVLTLPGGSNSFTHTGYTPKKFAYDMNANIGFEYRTEKNGFFYIGGSGRIPLKPIFEMVVEYKYQGYSNVVRGNMDGSYLALDFKYFFPNIKKRGPQFQPGPIE